MNKMKVVLAMGLFLVFSQGSLKAQDKWFNESKGLTNSAKAEVVKHKQYVEDFRKEKFSDLSYLDLNKQYIYQEWAGSSWSNTYSEINSIDTAGEYWTWTSEELIYMNSTWNNYEKYVVKTTPMSLGNPIILGSSSFAWVDNRWIEVSRISYTYNGTLLMEALIELAIEENTFMPFQKYSYEYNEAELVRSEVVSDYFDSSTWIPSFRSIYEYVDNTMLKEKLEANYRQGVWQDSLRTAYAYGIYDLPSEIIEYLFTDQMENPSKKYVYDYSTLVSGQLDYEHLYTWDGGDWFHSIKKHHEYNNFGLQDTVTTEENIGGTFILKELDAYTYNDANLEIELIIQYHDGNNWQNQARMLTIYNVSSVEDDITGIESFELYNNYPNPFNPATTISYSLPFDTKVALKVYNSIGEVVKVLVDQQQPAGIHKINFNADNLPSGIYLYSIQAGNKNETRKMILMK